MLSTSFNLVYTANSAIQVQRWIQSLKEGVHLKGLRPKRKGGRPQIVALHQHIKK